MQSFISKFVKTSFNATITKVTKELKNEGFGISTDMDVVVLEIINSLRLLKYE